MWKKYLKELTLPESYISITLGFLVVIVAGLLMYNFLTKNKITKTAEENKTSEVKTEELGGTLPATHTVTEGESLWSIAEKYYKSGYNWISISKENNLTNPDKIEVSQVLKIPKADVIRPPSENVSSTATKVETQYTVVKGDNLWNIAVKEYGDGFAWTKIAKANNLVNPRIIHSGNVLRIP